VTTARKTIAILDMWASNATAQGPSKNWLYNQLSTEFEVKVINAPRGPWIDLYLRLRSFYPSRFRWSSRYYKLKEEYNKTPQAFVKTTQLFQKALDSLPRRPDLVLQIGALFGPVDTGGVPYLSYHDQTVAMVEAKCPDWLPSNFAGSRDRWYALERSFYHSVTRVVTYSAVTKGSMVNDYGIDRDKVAVIHTACKMPFPPRERLLQSRENQILFVSTEFLRKGGDIILEAFPLIKAEIPGIRLAIAGGKLPTEITVLDPAITYLGSLSPHELQQQYLKSSLLVHPARYDAFPNVLKEAVVCGLPVVASASCGIPEILDSGKAGVVIAEPTAAKLAKEVVALLQDRPRYRNMQENCLKIREKFQVAVIGKKFIDLMKSCMESHDGN